MKKFAQWATVGLMAVSASAMAHGPVRGKMTATVVINAPAAKVWEEIKDYGDMSWLPAVKSVKNDKGNEKGAVRVLTLQNGATITEELKDYKADKMSYKYKITEMSSVGKLTHAGQEEDIPALPVGNYAADLSVTDKGGKAEVEWVATYYRAYVNNNPPSELNEEAADKAVKDVLTSGLGSLLHKFEPGAATSSIQVEVKR